MANDDETGGQAGVAARRAGHGYDVGLHAQDELGTFDVGLAVEGVPGAGESLGLYVQAPRVGRLKVAFAVTAEGVTRLAALERRDEEGVPLPTAGMVVIDEGKVLRLEAQVQRYEEGLARVERERDAALARAVVLDNERKEATGKLSALGDDSAQRLTKAESERDEATTALEEARDRAAALGDECKELQARLEQARSELPTAKAKLEAELAKLRTELGTEREQRAAALAEREKARTEIEVVREQLQGGAAELSQQLEETRQKLTTLQAERDALNARQAETATLHAQLEEHKRKAVTAEEQLQAANAASEKHEQADARSRTEIDALRNQLAEAGTRAESLHAKVSEAQAAAVAAESKLVGLNVEVQTLHQQVKDGEAAAANELESAKVLLEVVQSARGSLEAETKRVRDSAATREEALRNEIALLQAKVEAAQAEAAQKEQERAAAAAAGDQSAELAERDGRLLSMAAELEELRATTVSTGVLEGARAEANAIKEGLAAERKAAEQSAQERDEARNLARQLQSTAARATAERDEARNVARALHQKMAGGGSEAEVVRAELKEVSDTLAAERQIATALVTDKQKLQLQLDAVSRQLETERSARARLSTERDELREKLAAAEPKDFFHASTKPYELQNLRPTQPEMQKVAAPGWGEEKTDPGAGAKPGPRTPVKTDPLFPAHKPAKTDLMGALVPPVPPKKGK